MFTRLNQWLWQQWNLSSGILLPLRYMVGRTHESLFGYDPESDEWPYRLAAWMRLSGYDK